MRMLQRSVGHSHSRDSAIDTDLQVRLKCYKSKRQNLWPRAVSKKLFAPVLGKPLGTFVGPKQALK